MSSDTKRNSIPFGGRHQEKAPATKAAGTASLVVRAVNSPAGKAVSAADVARDDIAEALPALALVSHELKLGDRREIAGAGIDLDTREQAAELKSLDARRLLHDVLAGKLVAAGFQHMHERLRDGVAVHQVDVGPVACWPIPGEECGEGTSP